MKYSRFLFLILPGLLFTSYLYGVSASYNFSGDEMAEFDFFASTGDGVWNQTGGVGEFTSTSGSFTDPVLTWKKYAMPYDTDWTVSLQVTIPTFYDTDPSGVQDSDMGDEFVEVFLGVQFVNMGTEYLATSGLSVSSNNGAAPVRQYVSEFLINNISQFTLTGVTTDITGTVSLDFNSTTKDITFFGGGANLGSFNVGVSGDPDWGMTDSDLFTVGIQGTNNFEAVIAGQPIQVDNLSATGASAIPEPGEIGLCLGFLALGTIGWNRFKGK